jgi:NAD(P)-dependent dehydrogenase (short-subunit alcohol dehydrogenase family)
MTGQKTEKIVLITGCSSGFGFLTALQLAKSGHRVYATLRDLEKQQPLQAAAAKDGLELRIRYLDVTQPDSIEQCIDEISKNHQRLDVLINNAGYGLGGFFEDISDAEFRAQMETNFFGVLNVTRIALPLLRSSAPAKIINISSVAGLTATPAMGAYNASKWALEGFSESLRLELHPFGIQVLLIEPGPYPTKVLSSNVQFAAGARKSDSPYSYYVEMIYQRYLERNRTLRSAPIEVAELIEHLIDSPRPRFRHIIGPTARLRTYLRKFLPNSWYEYIVTRYIFR